MRRAPSASGVSLVALLWGALALNYVDRQMVYSIFPALKADLGFRDAQLGLIGSVFSWVYTLCMPLAGRVADSVRRDRMILLSIVLWSAATLGWGLSGSVAAFLLWRAAMGVTESLYFPAAVGALGAAYAASARSRILGIHQSAQFAGIVAGGWYGGWMADRVGWRAGFTLAAAAGIVYAFVLARGVPHIPHAPAPAGTGATRGRLAALLGSRCYVAVCAAFFCFCAMLWVFYAWYPAHLQERYRLSMTASGWNATLFVQASCGLGVVAGGALADRLARRVAAARYYVAAAGIVLSAPFGYLTFAAGTLEGARVCSCLYGLFAGLMIANVFAAAYDVIPARQFGFGAGLLNTVGGIAASITILVAGLVRASLGFAGLLVWVGALCLASAAALAATAHARFAAEQRSPEEATGVP